MEWQETIEVDDEITEMKQFCHQRDILASEDVEVLSWYQLEGWSEQCNCGIEMWSQGTELHIEEQEAKMVWTCEEKDGSDALCRVSRIKVPGQRRPGGDMWKKTQLLQEAVVNKDSGEISH